MACYSPSRQRAGVLVTLGCYVAIPQTGQLKQQMPDAPVLAAAKSPVDLVPGEGLLPGLQMAALLLRSLV